MTLVKIIAALVMIASTATHADTLGVHFGSQHEKPGYNNVNPGVYYVKDDTWVVGTVFNSMQRQSFYAGYKMTVHDDENTNVAITVGGITGYSNSVTPLFNASVAYKLTERIATRVSYLPRAREDGSAALHLSVEFSLH